VQNHGSGDGSRSVTCKGHAESRITCRGKAPWVVEAAHASRRAERKRSWQPSPGEVSARNRGATHVAREATGVSELVALSRSLDLDGMPRNGTKTPPRTRRSAKRFGRRENARFLGPNGCTFVGRTEGASPYDEPGAAEYGCSLNRVLGGRSRSDASSIMHRGNVARRRQRGMT
jgi:hypothetical protein